MVFAEAVDVLARGTKYLIIIALVAMTGAHWAALQTVAWTTMLANNLRTQTVSEAISNTFNGEYPCCLCKAIAAAKKAEKNSDVVAPVLKMEFPPVTGGITLYAPGQFEALSAPDFFATAFFSKPPLPPPRCLFA